MSLRLTFVLPDVKFTTRSGGYRVHYRMAEHLAARGHQVVVIHETRAWRVRVRARWWQLRGRTLADGFVPWYRFSLPVEVRVKRRARRRDTHDADRVLLTNWTTVAGADRLGTVPTFVLVWDYELWHEGTDEIRRAMCGAFAQPGLRLVAGSEAVAAMLRSMGLHSVATIPPGVELDVFRIDTPVAERDLVVGCFHRVAARRGTSDAMRALESVHGFLPKVKVETTSESGDGLPAWAGWRPTETDAELAEFYNRLAVFLLASRAEGLGLPAIEAMACGAALVVTDNGGSDQFARDGENALVVPAGDTAAMSEAITRLLDDEPLRQRIAAAGAITAREFTWQRATDALEELLGWAEPRSADQRGSRSSGP